MQSNVDHLVMNSKILAATRTDFNAIISFCMGFGSHLNEKESQLYDIVAEEVNADHTSPAFMFVIFALHSLKCYNFPSQ